MIRVGITKINGIHAHPPAFIRGAPIKANMSLTTSSMGGELLTQCSHLLKSQDVGHREDVQYFDINKEMRYVRVTPGLYLLTALDRPVGVIITTVHSLKDKRLQHSITAHECVVRLLCIMNKLEILPTIFFPPHLILNQKLARYQGTLYQGTHTNKHVHIYIYILRTFNKAYYMIKVYKMRFFSRIFVCVF